MHDLYLESKLLDNSQYLQQRTSLGKTNWKDSTIGKIMTNELSKSDYLHGKKYYYYKYKKCRTNSKLHLLNLTQIIILKNLLKKLKNKIQNIILTMLYLLKGGNIM